MGRGLTAAKAAWAGAAAVLAAALLWACIGPDSLLQNLLLDKLRARYAHGRLTAVSDQEPLGRRCPVLLVLGANTSEDPDGPGAGRARLYAGDLWRSLGAAYRARAGRELGADAKLYSFWYNSSADDCEIARSLNWLIEADPDLTRAHVKIAAGGHPTGATSLFIYWCDSRGRKLGAKFSLAGANLGTPLADPAQLRAGLKTAFPVAGGIAWELGLKHALDFDTPGMRWLKPGCAPLQELRRAHPLDASWSLFAGRIDPPDAGQLADWERQAQAGAEALRELWEGDGFGQYQVGAAVLESLGAGPSDGMVPLSSALCEGARGQARTYVLEGYDHTEMLRGDGGAELAEKVLEVILPEIEQHARP